MSEDTNVTIKKIIEYSENVDKLLDKFINTYNNSLDDSLRRSAKSLDIYRLSVRRLRGDINNPIYEKFREKNIQTLINDYNNIFDILFGKDRKYFEYIYHIFVPSGIIAASETKKIYDSVTNLASLIEKYTKKDSKVESNSNNGDLSQNGQQTQQEVEEQKVGVPFSTRVQSGFNDFGSKLASVSNSVNTSQFGQTISNGMSSAANGFRNIGSTLSNVPTHASDSLGKAGQTFSNGVSSAKENVARGFGNLGSTLDTFSRNANERINTAMNSVKGSFTDLGTRIKSRFQKGDSSVSTVIEDQPQNVGTSEVVVPATEIQQQGEKIKLDIGDTIDEMFEKIEKMGLSDNYHIGRLRDLIKEYNDNNISIDINLTFWLKKWLIAISDHPDSINIVNLGKFIDHYKKNLSSLKQSSAKDDEVIPAKTDVAKEGTSVLESQQKPLTANNSVVSVNKSLIDIFDNQYLKNLRDKVHTPNIAALEDIVSKYDRAGVKIPDEYKKIIVNYLYALINIEAASKLKSNSRLNDSYVMVEGGYLPKDIAGKRKSAAYNASYFVQNSESIINYLNNYINNSYSIEDPVSVAVPQQEVTPTSVQEGEPVAPSTSEMDELVDQLNNMQGEEVDTYDTSNAPSSYDYSPIINRWNNLINNNLNDFSRAIFVDLKVDIESAKLYVDFGGEIPKNIQDIIDVVDKLPNYDAFVAYKNNLTTSQDVIDTPSVTVEEVRKEDINQQQDMFSNLRKLISDYERLNGSKDYKTYKEAKEFLDMYPKYHETLSSIESQIMEIINGTNNVNAGKVDPFEQGNLPINRNFEKLGIVSHKIPQEKLNDYRRLYNQYVNTVSRYNALNGLFRNGEFERLLKNKIASLKTQSSEISMSESSKNESDSAVKLNVGNVSTVDINDVAPYEFAQPTSSQDPKPEEAQESSVMGEQSDAVISDQNDDIIYTEEPKNKSTDIPRAVGMKVKIVNTVKNIFSNFPTFGISDQNVHGDGHHTVVSKKKSKDSGKLKKGITKKIIAITLATFVGVGAFLVAGQPVSQNIAINTVVNGISAIGTAHSFGEVIRDFKIPWGGAKTDDSMAISDEQESISVTDQETSSVETPKPSVTSDEKVSKGDTSRQDSTVKEDTIVHSGDDIQIGDTVHVNNGSAIYDNVYDASNGTNPLKAYFSSDKDRSIKGVSIELGGNLYYSENQQEIDNLLRSGGKITSYVVGDKNGYEGAYNVGDVVQNTIGGMSR